MHDALGHIGSSALPGGGPAKKALDALEFIVIDRPQFEQFRERFLTENRDFIDFSVRSGRYWDTEREYKEQITAKVRAIAASAADARTARRSYPSSAERGRQVPADRVARGYPHTEFLTVPPVFFPAGPYSAVSSAASPMSSANGQRSPAASARRSVSRTVDGAAPTRCEIALWPSPCSNRCLKISSVRRQIVWDIWRGRLAECRPHPGVEFRRRVCGVASVDSGWSVV